MNTGTQGGFVRERYDAVARLLHWLVAGMIVLQFVLAKMAEAADEDGSKFRQLVLLANHKSVGITILAVAALRLGWRFFRPPPANGAMAADGRRIQPRRFLRPDVYHADDRLVDVVGSQHLRQLVQPVPAA